MTTAINIYVLVWAYCIGVAAKVRPSASSVFTDAVMAIAVAMWPITLPVAIVNRIADYMARNERGDR